MSSSRMGHAATILEGYRWLAECVLLDIRFADCGAAVYLLFDNIWLPDGTMRGNLHEPQFLTLKCMHTLSFAFDMGWSSVQFDALERVNWGINEISRVAILDNVLTMADGVSRPGLRVTLVWDSARTLDIRCQQLELFEGDHARQHDRMTDRWRADKV